MSALPAEFVEREYNLRAAFPDHPQWFARWAVDSAAARARLETRLDVRYGNGPKQTMDLRAAPRSSSMAATGAASTRSITRSSPRRSSRATCAWP